MPGDDHARATVEGYDPIFRLSEITEVMGVALQRAREHTNSHRALDVYTQEIIDLLKVADGRKKA